MLKENNNIHANETPSPAEAIGIVVRRETAFLALWVIGMVVWLLGVLMKAFFSEPVSPLVDLGLSAVRFLGAGSVAIAWLLILIFYRCPGCNHHLKWLRRKERSHCPKCGIQVRAEL